MNKDTAKIMVAVPNLGTVATQLAAAVMAWMYDGWDITFYAPENVIPHDAARNRCILHFLQSDCTHIFFLDDDVVPPRDALEKLVEANEGVVCGIYPVRRNGVLEGAVYRRKGIVLTPMKDREGVVEIDCAGAGCMLIKRKVLADIKAPWFVFTYDAYGQMTVGEDINFFQLLKDNRNRIYAHFDVWCDHHKIQKLTKSLCN